MLTYNHPQWLQYKISRLGLCAEICCNGGKKDFEVESGLVWDLFRSNSGLYLLFS